MKAKDLRELVNALKDADYADYELKKLFGLSFQEFQNVLEMSRNSIEICKVLLSYYCYCIENPKKEELLENHFEIQNARDLIAKMIMEADDENIADGLYQVFDGVMGGLEYVNIQDFQSQEEYFCYLSFKGWNGDTDKILLVIDRILRKTGKHQLEVLQKFFNYAQKFNGDFRELLKHIEESGTEIEIMNAFDLLQQGYDIGPSFSIVGKWSAEETPENKTSIRCAEDFLLTFPRRSNFSNLPDVFIGDYDDYNDTITVIHEIQNFVENPDEIIQIYINTPFPLEKNRKLLNEKIREVIGLANSKLISVFFDLLQCGYLPDHIFHIADFEVQSSRFEQMITIFKTHSMKEKSFEIIKECLLRLPYPMWLKIPSDANLDTLDFFLGNYSLFLQCKVFSLDDESSYDIIEKISKLSKNSLEKITCLLQNSAFCNDFLNQKHDELMRILFEKENESSLDYILEEYKKLNESRNQATGGNLAPDGKVELKFVFDLLESYSIEDVLDGFQDDEEITDKTMIRSIKYKS